MHEALVLEHLSLVRILAAALKRKLPHFIEFDDLYQEGAIGLMGAAQRFEASRNVPFIGYARKCITGAMLTSLRYRDGFRPAFEERMGIHPEVVPLEVLKDHPARESTDRLDLDRMIATLSALEQETVYLYYAEGWSQDRIAVHLGISQHSISSLLSKAIGQLREMVKMG